MWNIISRTIYTKCSFKYIQIYVLIASNSEGLQTSMVQWVLRLCISMNAQVWRKSIGNLCRLIKLYMSCCEKLTIFQAAYAFWLVYFFIFWPLLMKILALSLRTSIKQLQICWNAKKTGRSSVIRQMYILLKLFE